METRLVVAYALIATIVVVGASAAWVLHRQRIRRRRRLRGIKDEQSLRDQRRFA